MPALDLALHLSRTQRNDLLKTLLALPVLDVPATRAALLQTLPAAVTPAPDKAVDLNNIVRAVEALDPLPDGTPALRRLFDNALTCDPPNNPQAPALQTLLDDLLAQLPANSAALLSPAQRADLIAMLRNSDVFDSPEQRSFLLNDLPPALSALIPRAAAKEADLRAILLHAAIAPPLDDGTPALLVVLESAALLIPPDPAHQALRDRLRDLHTLLSAPPPVVPLNPPQPLFNPPARPPLVLNGDQLVDFGDALDAAFPQGGLRRVLLRLDQKLDDIAGIGPNTSLRDQCLAVAEWARQVNRLDELLAAALKDNPTNGGLIAFAKRVGFLPPND